LSNCSSGFIHKDLDDNPTSEWTKESNNYFNKYKKQLGTQFQFLSLFFGQNTLMAHKDSLDYSD